MYQVQVYTIPVLVLSCRTATVCCTGTGTGTGTWPRYQVSPHCSLCGRMLPVCLFALSDASGLVRPVAFESIDGVLRANGVPFTIKGAVWYGAEGPGDAPDGLSGIHPHTVASYMQLLAAGGFNALRIDFNHKAILEGNIVERFDQQVEPGLMGKHYLQMLHFVAQEAAKEGLLVALACTRLARYDNPGSGLWYSADISEAEVLRSWSKITNVLCAQPNVFAVNLYDAPHGATWGTGPPGLDWHAAARRIGNHVLAGCPRLLIMVAGARGVPWSGAASPELTPGINLMGVKEKPLQLVDPTKLVYAADLAPPSEHMLPAYRQATFPGNMPGIWMRQFGYLSASAGSAVIISRAGGLLEDALDRNWQQAVFTWVTQQKLGFFYDCINANPSNGGLLRRDWSTLREMKIEMLKSIPATTLASLPPPSPVPPGTLRPVVMTMTTVAPPMPDLLCLKSLRATGLRGALDFQYGGSLSSVILSIYTGPDWDRLIFEIPIDWSSHVIQQTEAGTRLRLDLNSTHCFPSVPVLGAKEPGAQLCFQIAAVTGLGKHIRYVNRGCATLERYAVQTRNVPLNDGGQLDLVLVASQMSVRNAALEPGLLALAAIFVALSLPLLFCYSAQLAFASVVARLLTIVGFTATAAALTGHSASGHAPLPTASELQERIPAEPRPRPKDDAAKIMPARAPETEPQGWEIGMPGVPDYGAEVAEFEAARKHSDTREATKPAASCDSKLLSDITALLSQAEVLNRRSDEILTEDNTTNLVTLPGPHGSTGQAPCARNNVSMTSSPQGDDVDVNRRAARGAVPFVPKPPISMD